MTRAEAVILAIVISLGCGLRAIHSERISVEHFDEGVYASNWYCLPPGLPNGVFPKQHLYAPPLLPNLCFWTIFCSGGNPHSVVWINIVAGTLSIPLLWWVGRSWFGPVAGILAAALCAFSDVHVALSRMVLTDVLLCLFLTAGVWTGVRALLTGRPLWIISGGVLAALAWWTKYNGWLTLAITGAGMAGWVVCDRRRDFAVSTLLFRWCAMAAIACTVWSPVLWGLQEHGGYAAVAKNHSRYVVGLAGWWDALTSQLFKLSHLESLLCVGLTIGAISATCWVSWSRSGGRRLVSVLIVVFAVLGASLAGGGIVSACAWLGLVAIVGGLWHTQTVDFGKSVESPGCALPLWTTLAWFSGLLLTTPMYTSYPRLTLPLVASIWLAASTLGNFYKHRDDATALSWTVRAAVVLALFTSIAMIRFGLPGLYAPRPVPEVAWQDRRGLEVIAAPLVDAAESNFAARPTPGREQVKAALYVFAEPGLFYHLSALPKRPDFRFFPQPMGDHSLLKTGSPHPDLATFIITGPHAAANADEAQQFADAVADGQLELVRSFPYASSDLVLLDQTDPEGLPAARREAIQLYRLSDHPTAAR